MKASYSRISSYWFCPKKYDYRYVQNVPVPVKPELAFGISLHETLEQNFLQKRDTRRDLPPDQACALFEKIFDKNFAPVPEEFLRGPSDRHYLRSLGQHFIRQFLDERAPGLQPLQRGVECSFRFDLPGGHELTGQFDLLDTSWVLHDFKTSSKPYDPRKADPTQLILYAWACEQMFGRPPESLCFDVFIKGDGEEGPAGLQAPVVFKTPSPGDLSTVAARLASMIDQLVEVQTRQWFPRAFDPRRCHWCEHQPRCQREWDLEGQPLPLRQKPGTLASG